MVVNKQEIRFRGEVSVTDVWTVITSLCPETDCVVAEKEKKTLLVKVRQTLILIHTQKL